VSFIVLAGFNPFNGVTPSFGPFQGLLQSKVGIFLALAWAIGFVYVAYFLLESIARMARARKGGYGSDLDETKRDIGLAAAAAVGLSALPVIYMALVS
jgi:hypothetical protein